VKGIRLRVLALTAVAAWIAAACGGGGSTGGAEALAADQTIRWSMVDDVEFLDPAHVSAATDIGYVQEVFSGLYRFDNNNKLVPDLATGMPDVSADGKTYTVKLNKNARFSNGDPLTSADVLYSWNRGAALNDAYASTFDPIVGGTDVESGKVRSISGLTAPDPATVKIELANPAGYFLSAIALPVAGWIVDQKVITSAGEDLWATKPETLVGSGPFKLMARTPKSMMEFAPVPNWWGGSTGAIKKVHVDIGIDQTSAVKKFEAGGYDLAGISSQQVSVDDVLRYKADVTRSKLLTLYPSARTTWMGFNFTKGPFQGVQPGHDGRLAFSQAVDRDQLVDVGCAKGATCVKATGGFVARGLNGYLGEGRDETARFDAAGAKSLYQKWNPDGSRTKGLQIRYNTSAVNTQIWSNVQSQLKANLGVDTELAPSDFPTLIKDRKAKNAILFRDSWLADYDHPQDWFDNLWTCAQAAPGKGNLAGYCNPQVDRLVQKADGETPDRAVSDYQQAERLMLQDAYGGALFYSIQPYLQQSYVRGAGYTGLTDYRWEGIRLLKH
jgi:oligopeptide transport system substrate-binding protein